MAYRNYAEFFRPLVIRHNVFLEAKLPADASIWARDRVCTGTTGARRHHCEEQKCENCTFNGYLTTVTKPKFKPAKVTFKNNMTCDLFWMK